MPSAMSRKLAAALTLALFCYVNNVGSQIVKPNVGIPLPSFKAGQGQSLLIKNDKISTKLNFKSSHPNSVSSRGQGTLQYISNPSSDKYVQNLIRHPVLLRGLQKTTGADQAVRVDGIITAHKQVVSGQIIYLSLRVVEVECPIGTQNVERCRTDYSEDPYICEMAVWERPWLNSTKIVEEKSRCEEFESDSSFKNWKKGSDDAYDNGFLEYPTSSLPYPIDEEQLALEAFNFVDQGSLSKFKGKMIGHTISSIKHDPARNITKIEVKVEYGFTLCIKLPSLKVDTRACPLDASRNTFVCAVSVASDPRFSTRYEVVPDDDDDIDCDEKQPIEELLVVPVKAPCTGCPQSVSLNDPKVMELADFAVVEYDRQDDDEDLHKMKKLIRAHYQVESSIKYLLTLELVETDCKKSMNAINMNRSFCNEDPHDTPEICDFLLLDQPWQKSKELLHAKCWDKDEYQGSSKDEFIIPVVGAAPRSSLSPGAFSGTFSGDVSPLTSRNEPSSAGISNGLQESIDFVLEYVNHLEHSAEDDDGLLVLQKVHQSESKIGHSGEEHHLVLELGETICSRFHKSDNCPLKHGEENEVCEARVQVRGQSSPRRISFLACDDLDDYMKKKLTPYQSLHQPFFGTQGQSAVAAHPSAPSPGPQGSLEKDPLALEVAGLVLKQYNLQSDDDELFKLGHIVTFLTQGNNLPTYLVELELLETECKKYQPVTDVAKCPVEPGEDPQFCQAEVAVDAATQGKRVTKLYCDDREDFFKKKIAKPGTSHHPGEWKAEDTSSAKVLGMGRLLADEFDLRSDKDNIFVLHRVLLAKTESAGLKHYLRVELSETRCPKYKPKINKTRCMVDQDEDLKVCNAIIVDQPWKNGHEVTDMSCSEKDRSHEDQSVEVLYRAIHPSAHVRPKFITSVYRKNLGSKESDESNEKYYRHGTFVHHSNDRESDEIVLNSGRALNGRLDISGTVAFRRSDFDRDDDDRDSDNDRDSHSREDLRFRGRRSVAGEALRNPKEPSLFEGAEAVDLDRRVWELASRALLALDALADKKMAWKVQDVLQATKKTVPNGSQWMLMLRVSETLCSRKEVSSVKDILGCKSASKNPNYLCILTVGEESSRKQLTVKDSKCYAEMS